MCELKIISRMQIEAIVEGYNRVFYNSIHFIDLFNWWTNEEVISSVQSQ